MVSRMLSDLPVEMALWPGTPTDSQLETRKDPQLETRKNPRPKKYLPSKTVRNRKKRSNQSVIIQVLVTQ